MVNHVAQGIFRGGGVCVKYQAVRSRWWSSACARETARNAVEMDPERQLKVKETEHRFWIFPGLNEGWKRLGVVSKNTTAKRRLYSCSVNKLNYLEHVPSFVSALSSYTDTVTRSLFACAWYSSALLHWFPVPCCPVSSHRTPWGRDCSSLRVCAQDKQLLPFRNNWNLWKFALLTRRVPFLRVCLSCCKLLRALPLAPCVHAAVGIHGWKHK